jgi:hypothetical protein
VPPTHHHRHHCLCWTTQSKSTNHYSGWWQLFSTKCCILAAPTTSVASTVVKPLTSFVSDSTQLGLKYHLTWTQKRLSLASTFIIGWETWPSTADSSFS